MISQDNLQCPALICIESAFVKSDIEDIIHIRKTKNNNMYE